MPPVQAVLSPENITQIQEIGRWGKGMVIDAVYSPDRTQLAVATVLGVYVYDAETAEQLSFIPVENIQLRSMAVSPDWHWVAMGIEPDQIEIRQLSDGSLRYTVTAPNGLESLTFTKDGAYVLAPYAAWRMDDGISVSSTYDLSPLSADGQIVALQTGQRINIAELVIQNEISVLATGVGISNHLDSPSHVALSPDGQLLAWGGWGDVVEVYQVSNGTLLYRLDFAPSTASIMRQRLASPAYNNSPGAHHVSDLEFTPDGQALAIVSGFEELTLWQMSDGRLLNRIPDVYGEITFSADGQRLAAWSATLTQWDMTSGTRLNQLKQHAGMVRDITFSPDGTYLAVASNFIYLRNVIDGGLLTSLPSGAGSLAISPDQQTLLSTSNNDLVIWDLTEGTSFAVQASQGSWGVSDVALSADGQTAATVSHDDAVRVWRVSDGQLLNEGYSMFGGRVAFSPTEPLLVFASHDGDSLEVWSLPSLDGNDSGQIKYRLQDSSDSYFSLYSLAFSPDGALLAAGLYDGRILIWRIGETQPILTLTSHTDSVTGVTFSPDGQLLASVSYDDTLRLWRVNDGVLLHTLSLAPNPRDVVFSPNGRFLATGSSDGLVRLWGVP